MEDSCPFVASLCLDIKEGLGFSFAKKPIVIGASYHGVQLYHIPIEPCDSPLFTADLSWAIPEEILKKIHTSKTPIRVEFYYHPVINRRNRIGFILVDVRKAFNTLKGETPIYGTHKVCGLSTTAKSHNTVVNLHVSIRPYDEYNDEPSISRGRITLQKRRVFCHPTTIQTTDFVDSKRPNVSFCTPGEPSAHFLITFEVVAYKNLNLITSKLLGSAKEDEVCIMFSSFFHKFCFRDITGIKDLKKCKTLSINLHTNLPLFVDYLNQFPCIELKMIVGDKFVGSSSFRLKDLIPNKKGEEFFMNNLEHGNPAFLKKCLVVKPNSGYGSPDRGESTIEFLTEVQYKGSSVFPLPENTVYPLPTIPELPSSSDEMDSSQSEDDTATPPPAIPPKPPIVKKPWRKRGVVRDVSKPLRRECLVKGAVGSLRRDSIIRNAIGPRRIDCATHKNRSCFCSERLKRKVVNTESQTECQCQYHDSACEDLIHLGCNPSSTTNISCSQLNFPPELFDCGLDITPRSDAQTNFPKPCLHYSLSLKEAKTHPENNAESPKDDNPLQRKLDITLKDSLANHKDCVRDTFTHICAELEDWKERQQEIFRFQLKKNTERHIQKLAHSWMKKQKVVEEDLTKRMQRCMSLTNSLSLASEELAARTQIVIKKEKELNILKDKLSEDYFHKFTSITDASKRYQYDMDHKMALLELERDDLLKRLTESEKERKRLEELLDLNQSQQKKSQDHTATIMIDMKSLEEKLQAALDSKAFFKEQWGIAVREVHKLKEEQQEFMQREMERSRIDLQKLGLVNILKENSMAKGMDDALVDEIRALLLTGMEGSFPRAGEGEGSYPTPYSPHLPLRKEPFQ